MEDNEPNKGPDEFVRGEPSDGLKKLIAIAEKEPSAWLAKAKLREEIEALKEENARLRKLIEKAFGTGATIASMGFTAQSTFSKSWEQFKNDNGL